MDACPHVERIMELCDGLDEDDPDQRDMKMYLTEHLLIKACAGYERQIKRILRDRAGRSGDDDLRSFVTSTVLSYKHVAIDRLQGNIVGKFSNKHKREFARRIKDDNADSAYGSIVALRNAVAHGESTSLTYDEFRISYSSSAKVLDELEAVLSLQSSDL